MTTSVATGACIISTKEKRKEGGVSMLKRITSIPPAICIALARFFRGIKEDERGLSGVVVAILLILIAVLAIVLIWVFLGGWLQELWERIVGEAGSI